MMPFISLTTSRNINSWNRPIRTICLPRFIVPCIHEVALPMDFSQFFNLLLSWLFVLPMGFLCLAPMRNSLRVHSRRVYPLMLILISSLLVAGAFFVVRFEVIPNAVLLPILFLLFLAYKKAVAANLAQACAVFLFFGCMMSVATNLAYAIDAAYNIDLGAGRESLRFGFFRSLFSFLVLILFYQLFPKLVFRLFHCKEDKLK